MDGTMSFFSRVLVRFLFTGCRGLADWSTAIGHAKHGRALGRQKTTIMTKQNADFWCSTEKKHPV